MQDKDHFTPIQHPANHEYMMAPGIEVTIEGRETSDYAEMRAKQLSALLHVMNLAEDCEHSTMSDDLRGNAQSLARTLADELIELVRAVGGNNTLRGPALQDAKQ